MVSSETKLTKFKTKSFTFPECVKTSVNMDLFSETHIPVMGDKHHGHPIVSSITRNLFSITTTYNFQNLSNSCCTFQGHTLVVCRVQRKKISGSSLKSDTAFHLRAFRFTSVRAVFPAVIYKMILISIKNY